VIDVPVPVTVSQKARVSWICREEISNFGRVDY
jgi:hypothetical protein